MKSFVHRFLAPLLFAAFALEAGGEARAGWERQSNGTKEETGFIDIAAGDATHAYAAGVIDVGGQSKGVIMYTNDGGALWNQQMPDSRPLAFYASAFSPSPLKCYVGDMGKILITTTGGLTWTESTHADLRLQLPRGIGGFGDLFAVTAAGTKILSTRDGGASWSSAASPLSEAALGFVFFVSASHGWITSGESITTEEGEITGYKDGGIIATADGGATWSVLRQGEARQYTKPSFINPVEGWVVSNGMTGPLLEKTTDGGVTWEPMKLPPFSGGQVDFLSQVVFFDRCEGFLLGGVSANKQTALFYTADGGVTWAEQATEWAKIVWPPEFPMPFAVYSYLFAMDFAGREAGWVSGSYEFIGKYTADLPAPNCGGTIDPDTGGWELLPDGGGHDAGTDGGGDEGGGGCGCAMVE